MSLPGIPHVFNYFRAMKKINISVALLLFCTVALCAAQPVKLVFDYDSPRQTIHSFGASDCWRAQYVGCWPDEKRNAIADLLFSSETDASGSPRGIGLTLWRFNIGSGSHERGDSSGVASPWRRTECFLNPDGEWDWTKQAGQQWFIKAARERGVPYILGFSITAPYFMTRNGMARASENTPYANLRPDKYRDYAAFMAEVCNRLDIDYLSPINEPQWEWVVSRQEGMQATNSECATLIRMLDQELSRRKAHTKVVFGEAGDIRYLYRKNTDKPMRDNQIADMFTPGGKNYIGDCDCVAKIVSGHSYWSTWPLDTLVTTRRQLREALPSGYGYWQTEYCPMEQNPDNPDGGAQRDTGMDLALYIARVIHYDLTVAEASSWQSWTALSEANYKDALIWIGDKDTLHHPWKKPMADFMEEGKTDGAFLLSKYLWALGNYSFFVRPGMVRLAPAAGRGGEDGYGLMSSAYIDKATGRFVTVIVNYGESPATAEVDVKHLPDGSCLSRFRCYETSSRCDLKYVGEYACGNVPVPARSVVTLVSDYLCKKIWRE